MMWNSLKKLRNLPDDTKIYCGHEYTLNNALFTKSVIPGELIDKKISSLNDLLSKKIPSIPSTIAEEKKLNLFFQADDSILKKELRLEDKNNIDMFGCKIFPPPTGRFKKYIIRKP